LLETKKTPRYTDALHQEENRIESAQISFPTNAKNVGHMGLIDSSRPHHLHTERRNVHGNNFTTQFLKGKGVPTRASTHIEYPAACGGKRGLIQIEKAPFQREEFFGLNRVEETIATRNIDRPTHSRVQMISKRLAQGNVVIHWAQTSAPMIDSLQDAHRRKLYSPKSQPDRR
jgi:hypothetical protein